jgi:hypothetical protein
MLPKSKNYCSEASMWYNWRGGVTQSLVGWIAAWHYGPLRDLLILMPDNECMLFNSLRIPPVSISDVVVVGVAAWLTLVRGSYPLELCSSTPEILVWSNFYIVGCSSRVSSNQAMCSVCLFAHQQQQSLETIEPFSAYAIFTWRLGFKGLRRLSRAL